MVSELGIKIKEIKIHQYPDKTSVMTFYDSDGGSYIHIIGDNDLVGLLKKALDKVENHEFQGGSHGK